MILTVPQLATQWGITPQRVRQLIAEGRVNAIKIGRQYLIENEDCQKPEKMKPYGRRTK